MDSYFMKNQLSSYSSCYQWLKTEYQTQKEALEHEMTGLKAIGYDGLPGIRIEESLRRSIVNDKLNQLEDIKKYRERIIEYGDWIIENVQEQYQSIFILRYREQLEITDIASQSGYASNTIYKIINRELNRISDIKLSNIGQELSDTIVS